MDIYSSGYVAKIYDILVTTSREDLDVLKDELTAQVPEPLHSLLKDKESKVEAKEKYLSRKKRETVMPTYMFRYSTFTTLISLQQNLWQEKLKQYYHSSHIEFIVLIIQI